MTTDTVNSISVVEVIQMRATESNEEWNSLEPLASTLILAGAEIARSRGFDGAEFLRAAARYFEAEMNEQSIH